MFERGDAWYRTGDLMRQDAGGYFYFIDRIGDTFRWKGENVSTSEVAAALVAFPGVTDATVYGVPFPAPRVRPAWRRWPSVARSIWRNCGKHLARRLPAYARPLFLRMQTGIAVTTTFKHQKTELARRVSAQRQRQTRIYFDDPSRQAYMRLDAALFQRIQDGAIRL